MFKNLKRKWIMNKKLEFSLTETQEVDPFMFPANVIYKMYFEIMHNLNMKIEEIDNMPFFELQHIYDELQKEKNEQTTFTI